VSPQTSPIGHQAAICPGTGHGKGKYQLSIQYELGEVKLQGGMKLRAEYEKGVDQMV